LLASACGGERLLIPRLEATTAQPTD
jgi:hypothetical protein